MAEDDGLLLNLFSHGGDENGEVNQGKQDRKLKVEYSILKLERRNQTQIKFKTDQSDCLCVNPCVSSCPNPEHFPFETLRSHKCASLIS